MVNQNKSMSHGCGSLCGCSNARRACRWLATSCSCVSRDRSSPSFRPHPQLRSYPHHSPSHHLRIEDRSKSRNASGLETIYKLPCDSSVGDDEASLRVTLTVQIPCKLDQIGSATLRCVDYESIWICGENRAHDPFSVRLDGIWCGPDDFAFNVLILEER